MKEKELNIKYNDIANWQERLIHECSKNFPDIEYSDLSSESLKNVKFDDMWKHFEFPVFVTLESDTDVDGEEMMDGIQISHIDTTDQTDANPTLFKEFVRDYVLEIFGTCNERHKNLLININKLINEGYDITVVSDFKGKIRPSIYYFLTRYNYLGNLRFTDEEVETISIEELNELVNKDGE